MDYAIGVRRLEVARERVYHANVCGRVRSELLEWIEVYAGYKHGFTELGARRLNEVLKAFKMGDERRADELLRMWGVRE